MDVPPPKLPGRLSWQQFYGQRRFGILLVILLILLAGPPTLTSLGLSVAWFDALMSVLMLAAILSLCFERQQRAYALLFGIPSLLFSAAGHNLSGSFGVQVLALGHLCQVLFLFGSAALIIKSLFGSQQLSLDSMFGAVCGYLFLGLGWAVLYAMIDTFQPGSFEFVHDSDRMASRPQVLTYFSFVTLSTVGYGDVLPVSPTTRTCAWMEAVAGQFYLAVIVAGLVSMLVVKRSSEA
jgi:hypothetical protein